MVTTDDGVVSAVVVECRGEGMGVGKGVLLLM